MIDQRVSEAADRVRRVLEQWIGNSAACHAVACHCKAGIVFGEDCRCVYCESKAAIADLDDALANDHPLVKGEPDAAEWPTEPGEYADSQGRVYTCRLCMAEWSLWPKEPTAAERKIGQHWHRGESSIKGPFRKLTARDAEHEAEKAGLRPERGNITVYR